MFDALFEAVRRPEKRFVVYARGDDGGVSERFAHHDVAIERRELPPAGPDPFLVIETEGEFVGAVGLEALEGLLDPPLVRPGDREGVSKGYRALFEVLDGTVFTGLGRRDLLAVSREVEDRAFRAGRGTLRAAFQRLSAFEAQAELYRHLATGTDLDTHVYGVAGWDPPAVPGVAYHETDAELGRYWVLAFEGEEHCALVARAEGEGFSGFWTDDAGLTGEVAAKLGDVC